MRVRLLPSVALPWLLLGGCLSPSPAPPAVRWFDAQPAAGAAVTPTGRALRLLRVTAAPHLERRFTLRIGPRELRFDDQHRWAVEPQVLAQQALERSLFGSGAFAEGSGAAVPGIAVHLAAFEIELAAAGDGEAGDGEVGARVELEVSGPDGARRLAVARVPARDREPATLAAAMATALGQAVAGLRQEVIDAGW